MGSFSNNEQGNVVNDTTGRGFDFNGNTVANNQQTYSYNPAVSAQDFGNTTAASQDIGTALNTLSQPYDPTKMFNTPLYNANVQLADQPINQQFTQQSQNLDNQLSAQNQTGSSYDALQHYYQNQNYANALNSANNLALNNTMNQYNQSYSNALNTLQGAENFASSYNKDLYAPLQMAISYQGALDPLQEQQASYYANKPTSGNQIAGIAGAAASSFS